MTKKKSCLQCLKVVSQGTRSKIIQQLKKKADKAGKIEAHFCLTQPTISYHLKTLKTLGMVLSKKKGRQVYYFLNKKYLCKRCLLFKLPFRT